MVRRFILGTDHSRSQQRTDHRVLLLTLKFAALKKTGFSPVKNTSQKLIGPNFFFHSTGLAAQTSPELIFHIINMSKDSSVSLSVVLM